MPDTQYKEVLISLLACMMLFLILAAIILLFLYLYQRRRLIQQQEMTDLHRQFTEQSLQAQLEIQEQTFLAISQEIHDNVGQVLSLAKVQINIITEREQLDRELLGTIKENIGQAMTDLRDLSRSLNGDRISSCPIHEILLQETERINRTGILQAEVVVNGEIQEMQAQKKLILFRILQESIHNCIKHARASRIIILFKYQAAGIYVSIRDNGQGFDPGAILTTGSGQGLGNIKTRVRLTGGKHDILSSPGEGTHITLTIPYE